MDKAQLLVIKKGNSPNPYYILLTLRQSDFACPFTDGWVGAWP